MCNSQIVFESLYECYNLPPDQKKELNAPSIKLLSNGILYHECVPVKFVKVLWVFGESTAFFHLCIGSTNLIGL